MNTQTGAPAGSEAMAASTPATETPRSLSDMIAEARQAPESAEPATEPDNEIPAQAENAAPAEEQPSGEAPEADEPAELPPIDPPRSWTQAEKERFQSLPRETQEYLHTREQEREREFRRSQNEVAEQRKAAQAEREAADKARQQYEEKARSALTAEANPFPDITTMADVEKLSNDAAMYAAEARRVASSDPFRATELQAVASDLQAKLQSWQVYQQRLAVLHRDSMEAEQRKTQERQTRRNAYEAEQNQLLLEMVPEMGDPKKAADLRERAVAMLNNDLGLKNDLLGRWMSDDTGHEILSNAGIQKLMADGLKYRDIQSAKVAAAAKPIPPVQRPGTAQPRGSVQSEAFTKTSAKIENGTGDHRDLSALLGAMRRA